MKQLIFLLIFLIIFKKSIQIEHYQTIEHKIKIRSLFNQIKSFVFKSMYYFHFLNQCNYLFYLNEFKYYF